MTVFPAVQELMVLISHAVGFGSLAVGGFVFGSGYYMLKRCAF
jgi:hypothetical protein